MFGSPSPLIRHHHLPSSSSLSLLSSSSLSSLGSLRYRDGHGHENVASKVNLRSFDLYRDHSNSFTLSNASELFLSRIPKNHIQVQKEKENLVVACLRPP